MRLKRASARNHTSRSVISQELVYFLAFLTGIMMPLLYYGMNPWKRDVHTVYVPYTVSEEELPSSGSLNIPDQDTVIPEQESSKPKCNKERKPYHVLLTSMSTTYLDWQARIMYYHFLKQKKNDPCNEMTGFTRLVANKDGLPDDIAHIIPSVFVKEIPQDELNAKYKGYAVLNRPVSVLDFVNNDELFNKIEEDYIFLAECDHVFLQPIPNDADENTAVGYPFGYMRANAGSNRFIQKYWPEGDSSKVDQVGPSPLIIHREALKKVAPRWKEFSLGLKADPASDQVFGWVLEMWGYAIAAGSVGIKHNLIKHFQCEPGTASRMTKDYVDQYYIHHYTYGTEYTFDGRPMLNTIGEWSLDKRHYGGSYPPRDLEGPPMRHNAAENYAATWLVNAWNEASAADPEWPQNPNVMGTVGWRREKLGDKDAQLPKIKELLSRNPKFTWAGIPGLVFGPGGELRTPWGTGTWGVQHGTLNGKDCSQQICLSCDFSNSLHNLFMSDDFTQFESVRVGDGERVEGHAI